MPIKKISEKFVLSAGSATAFAFLTTTALAQDAPPAPAATAPPATPATVAPPQTPFSQPSSKTPPTPLPKKIPNPDSFGVKFIDTLPTPPVYETAARSTAGRRPDADSHIGRGHRRCHEAQSHPACSGGEAYPLLSCGATDSRWKRAADFFNRDIFPLVQLRLRASAAVVIAA